MRLDREPDDRPHPPALWQPPAELAPALARLLVVATAELGPPPVEATAAEARLKRASARRAAAGRGTASPPAADRGQEGVGHT